MNSAELIMGKLAPLLKNGRPVVTAIDGRSAAGKSTTANNIADLYGGTLIIRMDDFFLPPELRGPERYEQPGGNVHYERFLAEVAGNLRKPAAGYPQSLSYRVFDCAKMDYTANATFEITPDSLVVIEGAYSLRPELRDLYDFKIFMDISPQKQERRIKNRAGKRGEDGEAEYKMFAEKWIPLEERYIDMFGVIGCCDLIINN